MATLLPEPETLKQLRHRWSRLIEVWVAYQVFLHREVEVGPDKICIHNAVVVQTTHTLLLVYYSYIYSLFDDSGIHFESITDGLKSDLTPEASEAREKVLAIWARLREPLRGLRHTIGFHGAVKEKSHRHGYQQLLKFHPLLPEVLMQYTRVFFLLLDNIFQREEPLVKQHEPGAIEHIRNIARAYEAELDRRIGMDEMPEEDYLRQFGFTRESYAAFLSDMGLSK